MPLRDNKRNEDELRLFDESIKINDCRGNWMRIGLLDDFRKLYVHLSLGLSFTIFAQVFSLTFDFIVLYSVYLLSASFKSSPDSASFSPFLLIMSIHLFLLVWHGLFRYAHSLSFSLSPLCSATSKGTWPIAAAPDQQTHNSPLFPLDSRTTRTFHFVHNFHQNQSIWWRCFCSIIMTLFLLYSMQTMANEEIRPTWCRSGREIEHAKIAIFRKDIPVFFSPRNVIKLCISVYVSYVYDWIHIASTM